MTRRAINPSRLPLRRTVAALMALCLAACSDAPPPIVSGDAHPPMWIATSGNAEYILIGSVHMLPPELDWQDERVDAAVGRAGALILELSPAELERAPALAERLSRDEPVDGIDARLGPGMGAAMEDIAQAAGVDRDTLDQTESWMLALMVGNDAARANGLVSDNGVETVLTRRMQAAGKPVEGLESAEVQLNAFDGIDHERQAMALRDGLRARLTARERITPVLRAWQSGDSGELGRLAAAEMRRTPWLEQPVVLDRNRAWAARLDARARSAQRPVTILVAVGAGHLLGPGSLVELLEQRGFTVTPLARTR